MRAGDSSMNHSPRLEKCEARSGAVPHWDLQSVHGPTPQQLAVSKQRYSWRAGGEWRGANVASQSRSMAAAEHKPGKQTRLYSWERTKRIRTVSSVSVHTMEFLHR